MIKDKVQPYQNLQLWLEESQRMRKEIGILSNVRTSEVCGRFSFHSACECVLCYPCLSEGRFPILKIRKEDEQVLIRK